MSLQPSPLLAVKTRYNFHTSDHWPLLHFVWHIVYVEEYITVGTVR